MTRAHIMEVEPQKVHRRTNSESSKLKTAGAYLHVKGKRKAPQPPSGGINGQKVPQDVTNSLKKKKRAAPGPPEKPENEILANDYLKLDHGVLKPVKEDNRPKSPAVPAQENLPSMSFNALSPSSSRTSCLEAPVSPRPWYKRNSTSKEMLAKKERHDDVERLPEVSFMRNSSQDINAEEPPVPPTTTDKKQNDNKRKSGMSFLTNISELDREASEIIKNKQEYERTTGIKQTELIPDIPEFMKPKSNSSSSNENSLASPKRRTAKDLIAKFNAITNATKVTVFGGSQRDQRYFGKQTSLDEARQRQEQLLESHKKRIEDIDKKKEDRFASPLMKSESAKTVKVAEPTPKMERKNWKCPKCHLENDYWRIICHVCSTIKPYFDDIMLTPEANKPPASPLEVRKDNNAFERSKTQIGFSALANYKVQNKVDDCSKKEERERLKKMLIEMKNSLPKRKTDLLMKQNSRTSIIMENPEDVTKKEKTQEEKVAEILIGTTRTVYENIKVRKGAEAVKPVKVSSGAQTSAVVKEVVPESSLKKLIETHKASSGYEPMKIQDFENIYSDKNGTNAARLYANLSQNDELSLFFNVPKSSNETNKKPSDFNTDTIEINRLLRRLESAIGKGDLTEAAIFAKELAQLKVNCSVIRQKPVVGGAYGINKGFQIEMYVEDKVSHRGPFPVEVTESQTVAQLKEQISREFEIPVEVQRWILGKELVTDDNSTLKDHKITQGCPVFLYLVAPEKRPRDPKITNNNQPSTSKAPLKTEAPKVVNVIPKPAEPCPIRVENKEITLTNNPSYQPPPSVSKTEIKVEIRPYSARNSTPPKEEKSALVKAKCTQVKVFEPPQIVLETPQVTKPLDVRLLSDPPSTSKLYPNLPKVTPSEDPSDLNTLKPLKEWECHLCTLLNPESSNICAVCSTVRIRTSLKRSNKKKPAPQPQTYQQLVSLDNADLVSNAEDFECLVCYSQVVRGEGVTLRECLHQFCKECLAYTVEFAEDAEVKCPFRDKVYSCNIALQDREIKALVSAGVYEQYLAKSVAQAENQMEKTFHCKTPDCKGWCIFEDNVNEFRCPVCRKTNCLTCQAIHMGANCKQYQERMKDESSLNEDAKRTKDFLEEMVEKGEAIACPTCKVILMKKWGCDWLRCSMCKTEICWVTRGPRWGPGGKGDTTGGCQCGVNGFKCHPKCNYCH
ncbi:uncharacterized protein LOC126735315 isoform X2 [Anthonomus grandis grandis]|nr:uncharacterized protein LOC126735315 isoform X2 [Anthonomus grandis grandis]